MNFFPKIKKSFSQDQYLIWILICCGILLYLNSLPNEMFWDDDDFILKNQYIKDWKQWIHYFKDNVLSGSHLLSNYWRPLLQIIFAIEWHLWADWAPGWRFVNIITHSLSASLLFVLLIKVFSNRPLAFLTSLMFLIHPAQSEAIVYPNSLGDSLSSLFIFAGIIFYINYRNNNLPWFKSIDWWLSFFFYPLALLSKETGITFLPYLILCIAVMLPQNLDLKQRILSIIKAVWPFLLIAFIYLILRATLLNFNGSFNFYKDENILTSHLGVRFLTFFRVLSIYCGILFTPYDLRVERLINPAIQIFSPDVLYGFTIFCILLWLAWRNSKTSPMTTFGILWFFSGILPTSNIFVLINALVYEHFLYTALIGIWLVVFAQFLDQYRNTHLQKILIGCLVFLFTLFSIRVIWRNTDWKTAIGFYEKLIITAPTSYRVINNLGMEYAEKGIIDKAEETYQRAIALDPNNAVAYHNLANIFRDKAKQGDLLARENAIKLFEKAITLQKDFIFSYKPLAQLYIDTGAYQKARNILELYCFLSEEKTATLESLIKIALLEKNFTEAQRYLQKFKEIRPDESNIENYLH